MDPAVLAAVQDVLTKLAVLQGALLQANMGLELVYVNHDVRRYDSFLNSGQLIDSIPVQTPTPEMGPVL